MNSVAATGYTSVCPDNDTTYILTASNKAGSVSSYVLVKGTAPVTPPPSTPPATPPSTPTQPPTTPTTPTTPADTEEVTFYVYREVTTKYKETTKYGSSEWDEKSKEACQQFSIQIWRLEGGKETFVPASSNSIGRNGDYSITLRVGNYRYKVNGEYHDPDGYASGAAGFSVVKGGRNYIEVKDYATRDLRK